MLRRFALLLLLALLGLAGVAFVRALTLEPATASPPPAPELRLDARRVCERLAGALRIPSVSSPEPDAVELGRREQMVDYVLETFAPLHQHLGFERHPAALVLRWEGSEPGLDPLLLLAHLDVVPADPEGWIHPPFAGEIAGGFVWGRGALDDKASAFAILEALEHLLGRGERPRRGGILALGLDEEVGGAEGAAQVAATLAAEGVRPFLVLDEGFAVLEGILELVPHPVAGVGVAEKGALRLELTVEAEGGHASMPERETALGILSGALARLEAEPMPARLDGAPALFFEELAREMEFGPKLLFVNRWLSEPLLRRQLEQRASTAALLRTTTAVTTASAGLAENVVPRRARATVDFRVHPRDELEEVLDHARAVIDDPRVNLEVLEPSWEASAISPTEGAAWEHLAATIRECYPGVQVAPALVLGATDARHYARLSPNVYRFNGLRLGLDDLARVHGVDERIAIRNYLEMIRFYARLIARA